MNINIEKILSKFDDSKTEYIKTLLYHERNKKVIYGNGSYHIMNDKGNFKVVSGLLPKLKECFWPNYDYFKVIGDITKMAKKKGQPSSSSSNNSGLSGNLRGSIIHIQLNDFLLLDKKNFYKKHFNLHPWAKMIIDLILENYWIPICSEFNIFDAKLKIGTSVDMIAFDPKNGKIIALEIKTGYKNHFEIQKGTMSGCLRRVLPFSFHNCAVLQLLTSMIFIIKNHNIDSKKIEGHIIHINDTEVNSYKISQNFILDYGKKIYDGLIRKQKSNIIKKKQLKKQRNINKTPIKTTKFK